MPVIHSLRICRWKVVPTLLLNVLALLSFFGCKHASSGVSVQWITLEEALQKSKEDPKTIMIDVYTDWCGWCKRMDETTFSDADVAAYIREHFYAVKLNAEGKKAIKYLDREVTERQLAEEVFGVTGFPTVVFLNSKDNTVDLHSGYQEPIEFKTTLQAFSNL